MTTEDEYIEALKKLILERVDTTHFAIFLFGGRAKGRRGKAVDVDVGFLGTTFLPLECLGDLYNAIEESPIPYKVDLVDFYEANMDIDLSTKSPFERDVYKNGALKGHAATTLLASLDFFL